MGKRLFLRSLLRIRYSILNNWKEALSSSRFLQPGSLRKRKLVFNGVNLGRVYSDKQGIYYLSLTGAPSLGKNLEGSVVSIFLRKGKKSGERRDRGRMSSAGARLSKDSD